MTQLRALAVVCLLLILVGGSVSVALGDSSRNAAETSRQIAVPNSQMGSVEVQILPGEHRTMSDQSVFFVARIDGLPEDADRFLLAFQINSDADKITYEFHHDTASIVDWPLFFPESDVVVHVRNTGSGETVHVPFILSPETKFSPITRTIKVSLWTEDFQKVGEAESRIDIRCTVECRIELFVEWIVQNLDRIVAVLSLLIAFFGRKKIWAALRAPRRRVADTVGGRRKRDVDTGGSERENEK